MRGSSERRLFQLSTNTASARYGMGRHSSPLAGAMNQQLTVELIPDSGERGFTARVPDIPAYGEGETEEEALADLKEALQAYIEAFGLEDTISRINATI